MMRFIRFNRSLETVAFEASELPIAGNAFLPSIALVPLKQHAGEASVPVVNAGERVREGQLLARGSVPGSVHVHAPVPGILKEFTVVPLPDGTMGKAARIQLSGSFDIMGRKAENYPWKSVSESELLRILEDKGVINTFAKPEPLVPALRQAKKKGSAILAIRLFDGDPTVQLDSILADKMLDTVLEGTALIAKALDATSVYLIHNGKKWNGKRSGELESLFQKRKVYTIHSRNRYPSGYSDCINQLLRSVNPACRDTQPIIIDPVTAISAFEAVVRNQPVLNRTIVVTGPSLGRPEILKVKIGTPIGDIIEECGGFKTAPGRIVVNGLLTGTAVYDLDMPVTKYTKSIHIMDSDTCPEYATHPCIHCGRCLQVCPVKIDPMRVVIGVNKGKHTPLLMRSLESCQFCGCCAIVCPSRIPLHQIMHEARERLTKGDKR